jgi:peroxiredoxin
VTDLTHDNTASVEPASGASRLQQAGVVGAVALIIILGAIWIARDQGAGQLGQGGVNSALLPSVGEPAPEFMTLYADGEIMRLSELEGQPVWLNFWGAWCAPCRAEMPELQEAWQILEPQGVKMIGVSLRENPLESVAYADLVGATFPIAADPNFLAAVADPDAFPDLFETAETWEIRNFPTHVFIDADGIVQSVILSQMDTETAVAEGEALLERAAQP